MAKKYHEITIKLGKIEGNKLKNEISDIIKDEVSKDMEESARKLLLYRKMKPGQSRDIPTFKLQNAGFLSRGVIENLDMSGAKIGKGSESRVNINKTDKGSEVEILVESDPDAKDRYDDYTPDAILRDISDLDPATASRIIEEAFRKAGF